MTPQTFCFKLTINIKDQLENWGKQPLKGLFKDILRNALDTETYWISPRYHNKMEGKDIINPFVC